MKPVTLTGVALCLLTMCSINLVYAGAFDRSRQSIAPLFAKGAILEFSQVFVSSDVEGIDSLNQATGDIAENYFLLSAAYKADLNQAWAFAVIVDQPWGVDLKYGESSLLYGGTSVEVNSLAITSLLKYQLNNSASLYGGPRLQKFEGNVAFDGLAFGPLTGYTLDADTDWEWGYSLGLAYEIPAYAARVDLTYASEIVHNLATDESISSVPTSAPLNTPASVNIHFQTAVSTNVLLFGFARWVEWSEFDFQPEALGSSITSYDEDIVSYALGLGRRFSPAWSGAFSIRHEPKSDNSNSLLRPTNGYSGIVVSATYTTRNKIKITSALNYSRLGDAGAITTSGNSVSFSDSDSIALGLKITIPL